MTNGYTTKPNFSGKDFHPDKLYESKP